MALPMPDRLMLCYHAVSETWPATLSVTPERLEEQLAWLADEGYRGVTATEMASPRRRRERLVAVTFDDAYRSVLERALPILDAAGMPGTLFVPTDFPDRPGPMAWPGIDQWLDGPHRDELECLTWEELRGLADAGWEIGSHTCSHPRLTQLDDAMLAAELRASRRTCEERLERPCRSIAYPYGDVDDRVVAAAGEAGYEVGVALPARWHRPEPLRWPRVGVYHGDGDRRFRSKVSPLSRRLRARAPDRLVGLARRALRPGAGPPGPDAT